MAIPDFKPAGYAYLAKKLQLSIIPHWHVSFVSSGSVYVYHSRFRSGVIEDIYPKSYWPGDRIGDHLEFALKYDGVALGCLFLIFQAIEENDLVLYIEAKPTGKYARRIWFFYEFLMEKKLPLRDLERGNYLEVLDQDFYYVNAPGEQIVRQRLMNNLLGDNKFCPVVRRTEKLKKMERENIHQQCENLMDGYSPLFLRGAIGYLYKKETKSSFAIEHIKPSSARDDKFVALLETAKNSDFCEKDLLIDLQNRIVDFKFKEENYRENQNYVGEIIGSQREIIHYISPQPEYLNELMEGLLDAHRKIKNANVVPIIHAAVIAYGFIYLHPFEDGNGRIHRFLIHNILATQGLVPKGLIFPVSALMLKNMADYNASLEAFSKPLMSLADYELDDIGRLTVLKDLAVWYRYMDLTPQAEALYSFIKLTVEDEVVQELNFLDNYDRTKKAIRDVIDMPDRLVDLFIRLCVQNNGYLSKSKRKAYFEFLSDEELALLEKFV